MKKFSSLLLISLLLARPGFACDSCSLFVATGEGLHGPVAAVAQQFAHFGTVWQGGHRLANPAGQYLNSSITQLAVSYAPFDRWQIQATLPYVVRTYRRPDHALIESGRVAGAGDATLAARHVVLRNESGRRAWSAALLGGFEFGTGNASHLGDEIGHHFHHHPNGIDSGIHGHDLALGSGSTDYVVGTDAEWRNGRVFVRGALQYKLRRPGKFGYRLADDTAWELGLGRFVLLSEEHSLAVQALFSADHKGFDTLGGVAQVDTGFNARYLGARGTLTLGRRFMAEASCELPVRLRTSETMIVPDYRLRAALTWRM